MPIANWYHLHMKPIGRSAGRSATAAVAYRLGERIHDETTELTHDYRARGGVVSTFTMAPVNAPEWAHDPAQLWNAVEENERRKNSVLARELEMALPAKASADARLAIVQGLSLELVNRYGVAVTAAIHLPDKKGNQSNHHAHIMFTTREVTEEGFGEKTRALDNIKSTGPEEVRYLRAYGADLINETLADEGSDERVTHLSNKDRGIEAEPTAHRGYAANAIEGRGEPSDRGDDNREIAENNAQRERVNDLVEALQALQSEIAQQSAHELEVDLFLRSQALTVAGKHNQAEVASWTFETLHQAKVEEARAEFETMAAERGNRWNEAVSQRVERIGIWWQNMRESFTEWRSQLEESVTSWRDRTRDERRSPEPERPATPPADADPPPPGPMEPST